MTPPPGLFPLLAQAAAPATGLGAYTPILFNVGLIFAIWYFLVIRPQQRQRRQHEQSLYALRKGDEVVTAGGIVAEVLHIKEGLKEGQPVKTLEDRVTVKSGESRLVVERGRIARVTTSAGVESKAG